MLSKFYKNISDFVSGLYPELRKFKEIHPDENIYASGIAKQSKMSKSDDVLDLKNWKSVKGGAVILTNKNIYFKGECLNLSSATKLELIKFKSFYGLSQIVKYVGGDGVCTCFSMQYDSAWSGHPLLEGRIRMGELKGTSSYILIFFVILVLWLLMSNFS